MFLCDKCHTNVTNIVTWVTNNDIHIHPAYANFSLGKDGAGAYVNAHVTPWTSWTELDRPWGTWEGPGRCHALFGPIGTLIWNVSHLVAFRLIERRRPLLTSLFLSQTRRGAGGGLEHQRRPQGGPARSHQSGTCRCPSSGHLHLHPCCSGRFQS